MFGYLKMLGSAEDRETVKRMYLINRERMLSLARRITGDTFMAEDAVHNSFVSIIKSFDRLPESDSEREAYLLVTVRNAAQAVVKERSRSVSTEKEMEDTADTAREAEARLCRERIWELIMEMDEIYSHTLTLKLYYGLDSSEIARLMNADIKTVNMRVHRAREKLKAQLREEGLYDKQ